MLYFFIVFGILIIIGFIYTLFYQKKLKKNGIETEGIVRVEVSDVISADEFFDKRTDYYVTYVNEKNESIKATIANPKKDLKTGDKIKIKYLPTNPKYAYYIKK